MFQKSNTRQESDFSKMSVSPRRHAHFEREGLAKAGQRGLQKPGQAREGQKAKAASPRRLRNLDFGGRGFDPSLKDGSESAHLETELSLESRPPIEKECLAKPGQSGRKEPGQETPKGGPGDPKGA